MANLKYPIHKNVQTTEHIRRELQKLGVYLEDIADRIKFCSNFTALVDPTVNDDVTQGRVPGCLWFNTVLDKFWILEENTAGAANWTLLFGGGGLIEGDKVEAHVTLLAMDMHNEITFTE